MDKGTYERFQRAGGPELRFLIRSALTPTIASMPKPET